MFDRIQNTKKALNGTTPRPVCHQPKQGVRKMTVTKFRPRKSSDVAPSIRDEIKSAIQAARGLEIAIAGEGQLSGFDSAPLEFLADNLTERLRAIAAKLDGPA
jgi:hypothetical protein